MDDLVLFKTATLGGSVSVRRKGYIPYQLKSANLMKHIARNFIHLQITST